MKNNIRAQIFDSPPDYFNIATGLKLFWHWILLSSSCLASFFSSLPFPSHLISHQSNSASFYSLIFSLFHPDFGFFFPSLYAVNTFHVPINSSHIRQIWLYGHDFKRNIEEYGYWRFSWNDCQKCCELLSLHYWKLIWRDTQGSISCISWKWCSLSFSLVIYHLFLLKIYLPLISSEKDSCKFFVNPYDPCTII